MQLNERAAQIMEHLISCPSHGYSQYSRNGDGGEETITLSDGSTVNIATGDRDCSSAVINAWKLAGVDVYATYTGNMKQGFLDTGLFVWHPGTEYSAKRGDIYLNEAYHTAMCLHPYGSPEGDILGEFSISETNSIDGDEGDSTGYESHKCAYYNYPWTGILEYIGTEEYGGNDMQLGDMIVDGGYIMDGTSYANVANCLYYAAVNSEATMKNTNELVTQITALSAAVEALATSKGVNPEIIAAEVSKAVADKLESIKLNVTLE